MTGVPFQKLFRLMSLHNHVANLTQSGPTFHIRASSSKSFSVLRCQVFVAEPLELVPCSNYSRVFGYKEGV
jgi:hypothetical protein